MLEKVERVERVGIWGDEKTGISLFYSYFFF